MASPTTNQESLITWFWTIRDDAKGVQLEIRSDKQDGGGVDQRQGEAKVCRRGCGRGPKKKKGVVGEALVFKGGWAIGLCTSFVNTPKKPMHAQKRERLHGRLGGRDERGMVRCDRNLLAVARQLPQTWVWRRHVDHHIYSDIGVVHTNDVNLCLVGILLMLRLQDV